MDKDLCSFTGKTIYRIVLLRSHIGPKVELTLELVMERGSLSINRLLFKNRSIRYFKRRVSGLSQSIFSEIYRSLTEDSFLSS